MNFEKRAYRKGWKGKKVERKNEHDENIVFIYDTPKTLKVNHQSFNKMY